MGSPKTWDMRCLRALCTALLLIAFALGLPLHAATAHGMAVVGGSATQAAHVHHAGDPKCCPDHHHNKAGPGTLCQMACASALAVLDTPQHLGARLAFAVRFAPGPSRADRGAVSAPDPFPPKPSRAA